MSTKNLSTVVDHREDDPQACSVDDGAFSADGGQCSHAALLRTAAASDFSAGIGQSRADTPTIAAAAGPSSSVADHRACVNQSGGVGDSDSTALARMCAELREQHRVRVDWHRAEKRLTLQAKAICRRYCSAPDKDVAKSTTEGQALFAQIEAGEGDHPFLAFAMANLLPLLAARDALEKQRKQPERVMRKLARSLPVWKWVDGVNGFGDLGLAQIVAEAGPLSNYSNPAKLWKRMGLAVIGGRAQRRVAGDGALEQGYSPQRRSLMFVIGDSLLKKQSPYRDLYLTRKAYETEKAPDLTKMQWHRRAQRYVEKRLLRDLWRAWRGEADVEVAP